LFQTKLCQPNFKKSFLEFNNLNEILQQSGKIPVLKRQFVARLSGIRAHHALTVQTPPCTRFGELICRSVFFTARCSDYLFLTQYKYRYIRMSTHLYKYTHVHSTSMSTSERLTQLDLKIYEVGHQEQLAVDGDIMFH
jgi:hypothetical protein